MAKTKKAKKKPAKKKKVSTKTKTKKMEQQQEQPEGMKYEFACANCGGENLLLLNVVKDFTEGKMYLNLICANCETVQHLTLQQIIFKMANKKKVNHPYKKGKGWETENKIIRVDRYLYDKNESGFTEYECLKEIPSQFRKTEIIRVPTKKMIIVVLKDELLCYRKLK